MKSYLTRAQTRAWSLDAPVGDPFGGPAFGERLAPIAIVGLAASAAGAMAATGIVQGVMLAGVALQGVGMATKNDKLTRLGALASLAGGVGGMMSGAGQAAASTVAQQAATEGAEGAAAAAAASPAAGELAQGAATASGTTAAAEGVASAGSSIIDQGADALGQAAAGMDPLAGVGSGGSGAPLTGVGSGGTGAPLLDPGADALGQAAQGNPVQTAAGPNSLSWLDKARDAVSWTKENPELVKTGAGLIGGAMKQIAPDGETRAKTDYYRAKAAELDRQIAMSEQARARMNAGVRGAAIPFSANAQAAPLPQPGLVNRAMGAA